ncbi:unnamed protein product [Litomosoides sigmodontis]|uniref:Uncharacterized protein n=1 Tax=Litomosoides sigmodontis TaxID=42156 RepID=A0A3P6VD21_LITSI|nr:unnamed protein product [Litomosoides sigmodontis]
MGVAACECRRQPIALVGRWGPCPLGAQPFRHELGAQVAVLYCAAPLLLSEADTFTLYNLWRSVAADKMKVRYDFVLLPPLPKATLRCFAYN